VGGDI